MSPPIPSARRLRSACDRPRCEPVPRTRGTLVGCAPFAVSGIAELEAFGLRASSIPKPRSRSSEIWGRQPRSSCSPASVGWTPTKAGRVSAVRNEGAPTTGTEQRGERMSNGDQVAVVTGVPAGSDAPSQSLRPERGCSRGDRRRRRGLAELGDGSRARPRCCSSRSTSPISRPSRRLQSRSATFGEVHLMSNNAGVALVGTTWDTPIEVWRKIFDVNVFGIIHMMKAFVPRLLQRSSTRSSSTRPRCWACSPRPSSPPTPRASMPSSQS